MLGNYWVRNTRYHGTVADRSVACRIRGAAKYSPITVTDVQIDGRPRAVPRGSHGALPLRDAMAAAGLPSSVLTIRHGNNRRKRPVGSQWEP
eukprot:scaffold1557_cov108-Isochrysis_galbana.AAC.7